MKKYRENHREEILEYQKKYYESHYEKKIKRSKEYYQKHQEEVKEKARTRNKTYRETHKEQEALRKAKWLAGQLGKNEVTVSRWCSNASQPSLEMLMEIAAILQIVASQLINKGME